MGENMQSPEVGETAIDESSRKTLLVAKACPTGRPGCHQLGQLEPSEAKIEESNAPATSPGSLIEDFFTSLQWSPDGTTVFLPTTNHTLQTYILPPTLLNPPSPPGHHTLKPYSTHTLPEPFAATDIHPSYNLSNPATCLCITSPRNLPIRLLSPFAPSILASYPLINATTEAWVAPHSLLFSLHDGNTFYAGADGFIAVFDLQGNGEGPVTRLAVGRGRKRRSGGARKFLGSNTDFSCRGRGVRGIVSALAMNSEGILAAGTYQGGIGLVDPYSDASCAVYDTLPLPADAGNGITSLRWHPEPSKCNYLIAASRLSETMHVFDVRNPGLVLATLKGRKAMTQQRLGVDVTEDGKVWAGGTDGNVKVWEELGMREGDVEPALDMPFHGDAVGGLGLHPGGAGVLATCAGSRRYGRIDSSRGGRRQGEGSSEDSGSESDSSKDDESEASQHSTGSSATSVDSVARKKDDFLKVWAI